MLVYRRTSDKAHWRLAHNHVQHSADMMHGVNGFRRFWVDPKEVKRGKWVKCPCGWRPDLGTHYAIKEHAKRWRCDMFKWGPISDRWNENSQGQ
ncbi:hypothetical protein [Bradyrhizobium sp. C9]|uniref:hypothetical protein n=1 Tax=Bradyrhizobium sp. C9 TaxID=142585 RepID=UPI001178A5D7|nr:hypothetical protein [Bradyrhizobium sp. C9]